MASQSDSGISVDDLLKLVELCFSAIAVRVKVASFVLKEGFCTGS